MMTSSRCFGQLVPRWYPFSFTVLFFWLRERGHIRKFAYVANNGSNESVYTIDARFRLDAAAVIAGAIK